MIPFMIDIIPFPYHISIFTGATAFVEIFIDNLYIVKNYFKIKKIKNLLLEINF